VKRSARSLEICEDRYQTRSTVLTSQLPVSRWHEQIAIPLSPMASLDRLVHNAHRIEMRWRIYAAKTQPTTGRDQGMSSSSTSRKQGQRGCCPFPCTPNPPKPASASLRTISLDDSEHLLHNHPASVASLRLLFAFAPECRSASPRNRCFSPSPEYPTRLTHLHSQLSPTLRRTFQLRDVDGLSIRETAQILGVTNRYCEDPVSAGATKTKRTNAPYSQAAISETAKSIIGVRKFDKLKLVRRKPRPSEFDRAGRRALKRQADD